jgi:YesN/AraC family two-component response regulator
MNSILLIDNDTAANFLHERIILKMNVSAKVMIAVNGKEAISWILQGNCPDVILIDIKLPEAEGIEFFRLFNQLYSDQNKNTTIAILSTSTHFEDRRKAQKLEITHHIIKPLTEQKLIKLINGTRKLNTNSNC